MMKKLLNISIISVALFALLFSSCYEQDVVAPIEPGGLGYTTATFTTDFTGTEISEGDTITYDIELSKPVDFDLTFSVKVTTGDEHDVSYQNVTIPAYATSATLSIEFIADDIPELDKDITLEIGIDDIGTKYQVVNTNYPVLNLKIKNVNDPGGLTIAVEWPNVDDDWDAYLIDEAGLGDPTFSYYDFVGYTGATGANPEVLVFLEDFHGYWTAPDGVYYLDLDPYAVNDAITPFTCSIGHPDGTVEFINFTFDMAKADAGDYPMTWGYSTLKIVKTGLSYEVSLLPQYSGTKSATVSTMKRRGNYVNMQHKK